MRNLHRIILVLLAVALTVYPASAQQRTGIIKGTLTDDSGAVIPAAVVTLTAGATRKTVQAQVDGVYTFIGLAPGDYTVSVTFPGFSPFSKLVTVSAGGTVQLPIQLSIRSEKEEITVKGEPGASVSVEPDNNATALVIKGDDLMALPDDPDDLADALQALAGPGAGPNGGSIYIDGFSGGQLPPKESIREIRINQNPFSAEFDRLGFGRIEILTRPGTDKFRGTAFFNDTDSIWDSRNPFASNKPPYSVRNFGGNVSGPINHKTSFNFDVQRRNIQNNLITNAFYVDPTTYGVTHLATSLVAPTHNTTLTPRLDYAITDKHTLTVRFEERFNSADNQGYGGNVLPPGYSVASFPNDRSYDSSGNAQNLMVTETSILTSHLVNETRFQFTRTVSQTPGNLVPSISVSGEFSTGGNGIGNKYDTGKHFELTNTSTYVHATHTIHAGVRARRESDQDNNPQGFNGTFTFGGCEAGPTQACTGGVTSLEQYILFLQLQQQGLTGAQIQALGGGPTKFSIQSGISYISMDRWDASPFVQDDWRVRPNFTLSLGLRYEVQSLISDHRDWAPRVGFAFAPGSAKNGPQKTVIRGGYGIFYDRICFGSFENAALNNGINQLEYTVYNPTFFPIIPNPSTLTPGQNTINIVDPKLRADYSLQSAIGVERQLPHNTTVAVTYTNNRANHMGQTVPINAPLPGTYNVQAAPGPTNGIFPYGYSAGDIYEYESGGLLKQNIVMVNFNTRFNRRVSLQGNYQYTHANDLPGTPTNPYNFMEDWGTSNLNRRSNLTVIGTLQGPYKITVAPTITAHSGAPYDVVTGQDIYGDQGDARALFAASGAACGVSGVVCTPLGNFSTNYSGVLDPSNPGKIPSNLVPRNYLTMPDVISINMRIYRVFGFGARRTPDAATAAAAAAGAGGPGGPGGFGGGGRGGCGGGPGGGGGRGGGGGMRMGGGGGRGGGGGASSDRRYSVQVGATISNALNHLNPGGYQGVLTSNQFGQATSVNTNFGGGGPGGGAGSTANNRRIDLSVRLSF